MLDTGPVQLLLPVIFVTPNGFLSHSFLPNSPSAEKTEAEKKLLSDANLLRLDTWALHQYCILYATSAAAISSQID